ncbi:hypothetical protein BCR34DRAFT_392536 [Clohesyomyces aquaticus]|uniref:Uncharacterized protein n=1 Tax=Clohesyomyces aquaticus TaxID=1231657 RepID=A0A1Y1ZEA7_9PLEO|nr:hypothetical protein BCR34DRAFT_392536 [Clohesyomyces aquaticus]
MNKLLDELDQITQTAFDDRAREEVGELRKNIKEEDYYQLALNGLEKLKADVRKLESAPKALTAKEIEQLKTCRAAIATRSAILDEKARKIITNRKEDSEVEIQNVVEGSAAGAKRRKEIVDELSMLLWSMAKDRLHSLNDDDLLAKARLFFVWVALSITYDRGFSNSILRGHFLTHVSGVEALQRGEHVCSGIASLFVDMVNAVNRNTRTEPRVGDFARSISGFLKITAQYIQMPDNHRWADFLRGKNAVERKVVDPTNFPECIRTHEWAFRTSDVDLQSILIPGWAPIPRDLEVLDFTLHRAKLYMINFSTLQWIEFPSLKWTGQGKVVAPICPQSPDENVKFRYRLACDQYPLAPVVQIALYVQPLSPKPVRHGTCPFRLQEGSGGFYEASLKLGISSPPSGVLLNIRMEVLGTTCLEICRWDLFSRAPPLDPADRKIFGYYYVQG